MYICIFVVCVFWKKNMFKLGSMKHQPDIKSEQEGNEDSWNDYVT